MIFIKTDRAVDTLKRLGVTLSQMELSQAESRAINKSLGKSRTMARAKVKTVYNISQNKLSGVNFIPSRPTTLWGKLYASKKPIGLEAFSPKEETSTGSIRVTKKGALKTVVFKRAKRNPVAGISIEIFRGKREVIPYAFLINGGAVKVFARGAYKTGTKYGFVQRHQRVSSEGNDIPIKPLITISQFGMILNKQVLGGIVKDVMKNYPQELEKQIMYQVSKRT